MAQRPLVLRCHAKFRGRRRCGPISSDDDPYEDGPADVALGGGAAALGLTAAGQCTDDLCRWSTLAAGVAGAVYAVSAIVVHEDMGSHVAWRTGSIERCAASRGRRYAGPVALLVGDRQSAVVQVDETPTGTVFGATIAATDVDRAKIVTATRMSQRETTVADVFPEFRAIAPSRDAALSATASSMCEAERATLAPGDACTVNVMVRNRGERIAWTRPRIDPGNAALAVAPAPSARAIAPGALEEFALTFQVRGAAHDETLALPIVLDDLGGTHPGIAVRVTTVRRHAPVVALAGFEIEDGQRDTDTHGNSNGRIDPGEDVALDLEFENQGDLDAADLRVSLTSARRGVHIHTEPLTIPSIARCSTEMAQFSIAIDPGAAPSVRRSLDLQFRVTDAHNMVIAEGPVPIAMGERPETPHALPMPRCPAR